MKKYLLIFCAFTMLTFASFGQRNQLLKNIFDSMNQGYDIEKFVCETSTGTWNGTSCTCSPEKFLTDGACLDDTECMKDLVKKYNEYKNYEKANGILTSQLSAINNAKKAASEQNKDLLEAIKDITKTDIITSQQNMPIATLITDAISLLTGGKNCRTILKETEISLLTEKNTFNQKLSEFNSKATLNSAEKDCLSTKGTYTNGTCTCQNTAFLKQTKCVTCPTEIRIPLNATPIKGDCNRNIDFKCNTAYQKLSSGTACEQIICNSDFSLKEGSATTVINGECFKKVQATCGANNELKDGGTINARCEEKGNITACKNSGGTWIANKCSSCPEGTHSSNRICTPCPLDSMCKGGDAQPQDCKQLIDGQGSDGFTNTTGLSACNYCPEGKEFNYNTRTCNDCPIGQLKEWLGGKCYACPAGFTTLGTGTKTKAECNISTCPANSTLDPTNPILCTCNAGYSCSNDSDGKVYSENNSLSCPICPTGYYCQGSAKKVACPVGQYQDETGKTSCKPCPTGFKTSGLGAKTRAECSVATSCGLNEYLENGKCLVCARGISLPANATAIKGDTNCSTVITGFTCNSGYTKHGNICQANTKGCAISNGTGSQSITNMIAGNELAYSLCTPTACNSGFHKEGNVCISNTKACTISNGTGSQTWTSSWGTCTPTSCNPGYMKSGTVCTSCSTGFYKASSGLGNCVSCPVGQYQDAIGKSLCKSCPSGYTSSATGASSCTKGPELKCRESNGQWTGGECKYLYLKIVYGANQKDKVKTLKITEPRYTFTCNADLAGDPDAKTAESCWIDPHTPFAKDGESFTITCTLTSCVACGAKGVCTTATLGSGWYLDLAVTPSLKAVNSGNVIISGSIQSDIKIPPIVTPPVTPPRQPPAVSPGFTTTQSATTGGLISTSKTTTGGLVSTSTAVNQNEYRVRTQGSWGF